MQTAHVESWPRATGRPLNKEDSRFEITLTKFMLGRSRNHVVLVVVVLRDGGRARGQRHAEVEVAPVAVAAGVHVRPSEKSLPCTRQSTEESLCGRRGTASSARVATACHLLVLAAAVVSGACAQWRRTGIAALQQAERGLRGLCIVSRNTHCDSVHRIPGPCRGRSRCGRVSVRPHCMQIAPGRRGCGQ